MPDFQDILYQKHHRVRGAAWITINRPDVMNSFTGRTLTEMRSAVDDAGGDPAVGVIVITGAGDRAFCAGGDVRWLQEVQHAGAADAAPMDPHAGIEDCLKPVIARVNGYAIGGGNHMAYFADFTIASEQATFAQVGPRVGSPAAGHFVAYLTHVVGAKKAKEIWMLCHRYSAQEAREMGLVNVVVPHARLDEEVDKWCQELMQKSPACLKILKASFRELYRPLREGSGRDWVKEIAPNFYSSGEADEGKNAFLARREPDFSPFPR
ncbi:MAG: enoyl-CoA hydratase-related protein [Dehalococcoidia bacterium]|nr:enoyl-CoA hydratase-related protein [Dehalococcoidia bacterium]